MTQVPTARRRSGQAVLLFCFAVIVLDGYDLVIFGAVVPSLLEYQPWAMTPQMVGAVGSYALMGMLIGALLSGYVSDRIGRRKVILATTLAFSIMMVLCGLAPTAFLFGLFRFIAGIALGGVLPAAFTLGLEFAPQGKQLSYAGAVGMGYPVGGVVVSVLAVNIVPDLGFRPLFVIGGVIGISLLPLLYRSLPESIGFLAAHGEVDAARRVAGRYSIEAWPVEDARADVRDATGKFATLRLLFTGHRWRQSLLFPLISYFSLLVSYGMWTWLPQILRQLGFTLGSSLAVLIALSAGNFLGNFLVGKLADRFGPKRVEATCFLIAAVLIILLSARVPGTLIYVLVLGAGIAALGAQTVLIGFAGASYPPLMRGTATGWATGIGRLGGMSGPLIGGLIIGSGADPAWNFYAFGAAAVLAAVLVFLLPRGLAEPTERVARRAKIPAESP